MWFLSMLSQWIPDIVFHLLVVISALGLLVSFLTGFFPIINPYRVPVQIVCTIVLLFSVWYEGVNATTKAWEEKAKALQEQVDSSEQKAKDATAKIEYVYIDRVKVVQAAQVKTIAAIQQDAAAIDKVCTVAPDAVDILNASASNPVSILNDAASNGVNKQ